MAGEPLLMVAGEASGDLHGARLLSQILRRRPDLEPFGLGGSELETAGLERLADSAEISVVGIVEVAKIYRRAREIFDHLLAEVDRRGARHAVLVDFPDFNLRLAKQLKQRGVKVYYYVSPQIWAWRRGRVKAIARDVELMLVLFPFESAFYADHGVDVVHVGHPLVDEVPPLPQRWDLEATQAPRGAGDSSLRLALLPGSRPSELRALLPTMAEVADRLRRHYEAEGRPVEVQLIQAASIDDSLVDELLAGRSSSIQRVRSNRFESIAESHLALCASGTATLEVGLLTTPMLVLYRLKWTSYLLAKLLVDLPHFCMVNLVLERRAVPELLQREASATRVVAHARALLDDVEAIATMRHDLGHLRERLGEGGASSRAAEEIVARLPAAAKRGES